MKTGYLIPLFVVALLSPLFGCGDDNVTGVNGLNSDTTRVDSVAVYPGLIRLKIGGEAQFSAQVFGQKLTDRDVIWSVGSTSVARLAVNNTRGAVRAEGVGQTLIEARSQADGEVRGYGSIVVEPWVVNSVEVVPRLLTVAVDERFTLVALVDAELGAPSNVTWTSSETTIARMDGLGRVTGVAPGRAIITAASTANPNKKAVCEVLVVAP